MCGIAGFWGEPEREDYFRPVLEGMAGAMRHRGPDDSGTWCDPRAGLGLAHARLAVLDLSPKGRQPMISADGNLVLVYNGEVYNYRDIRAELESQGTAPEGGWRGGSDTEVVLAAFAAWGVGKTLPRLNGMFALALYDRKNRALCLARDRMGKKPLYYAFCGDALVFASELKPMALHPAWSGRVDRKVLALYLERLFIPSPHCIFQGAAKLPPGSFAVVRPRDLRERAMPEPHRYWRLEETILSGLDNPFPGDETEAADELEKLLLDSVKARMLSDAPLGGFLSGGIDSSTVAALMQAQSSRPVKTFCIGYADPEYDESKYAAKVAAHLGCEHRSLIVSPDQALAVVPDLARIYDEPFADASQIPTFLVSRLAREEITVSLSGDGGDELFGGYNRYLIGAGLWARLEKFPRLFRRMGAWLLNHGGIGLLSLLYKGAAPLLPTGARLPLFRDKLQKTARAMSARDRNEFYHGLVSFWSRDQSPVLGAGEAPALADAGEGLKRIMGRDMGRDADFVSLMMGLDQAVYLPDDIMCKVDRASMAVSLEARAPFLDHRVLSLAWSFPPAMRIQNGRGKRILRRVLERSVPRELIERPKLGFGIPIDSWLRGPLRDWADELLDPGLMKKQGFLDPAPVRAAFERHLSGRANLQYHLWGALMFQAWLREYKIA